MHLFLTSNQEGEVKLYKGVSQPLASAKAQVILIAIPIMDGVGTQMLTRMHSLGTSTIMIRHAHESY